MSGVNVTVTPFEGKEDQRLLNLTGKTDMQEEGIEAYVTYQDTSDTEKELVIGKLNTISYDKQDINLVIVPVNGDAAVSIAEFKTALDDIYKQSVVNWNVTLDEVFKIDQDDWDKDEDNKMNDGESTLLSNYSDEQNKFKRKYKRTRDIDNNAYYVFLLNGINSKSGLEGYMPFKEQYAFVYSNGLNVRTIAHELGHGAFRLWHTFSSESDYYMNKYSSDNLMDYNNGERLHKYQWDFIHNPEGGLYLFQDEEEAAYISNDDEIEWVLEIYSPMISEKFLEAKENDDYYEMRRLTYWALQNSFNSSWNETVTHGFDLPNGNPVATLRHHENAQYGGVRVYYTYNKYVDGKYVGIKTDLNSALYFPPSTKMNGKYFDARFPVDVKLFVDNSKPADGSLYYASHEFIGTEVGTEYVLVIGDEDAIVPFSLTADGAGFIVGYMKGFGYVEYAYELTTGAGYSAEIAHVFDVKGNFIGQANEYGPYSLTGMGSSVGGGFVFIKTNWKSYNIDGIPTWDGVSEGLSAGYIVPSESATGTITNTVLIFPRKQNEDE